MKKQIYFMLNAEEQEKFNKIKEKLNVTNADLISYLISYYNVNNLSIKPRNREIGNLFKVDIEEELEFNKFKKNAEISGTSNAIMYLINYYNKMEEK